MRRRHGSRGLKVRGLLGRKMGVRAEDLGYGHSSEADETKESPFTSSNIDPKTTERVREVPVGKTGGYFMLPRFSF